MKERALTVLCLGMVGAALLGRLAEPTPSAPMDASGSVDAAIERADAVRLRLAEGTAARSWLLDPNPTLRTTRASVVEPPLGAAFVPPEAPVARAIASTPAASTAPVETAAQTSPIIDTVRSAQLIPLPMRRPNDLLPSREIARLAARTVLARAPGAASEAQAERSFLETVFGTRPDPGPALAYAPIESNAIESGPRRLLGPVAPPRAEGGTAIYDITARTVTLPSGERLEAHSGLGAAMDNPRHVHLRMRGSTPPGTYDLRERERLFHGVRAIRLTPVGGSAAIHGRDGILAHTYMLGPSGASNGCVSFKDYNRFLQAYLRGEVQRLVVVAGTGRVDDEVPVARTRALRRVARADAR